MNLLSRVVIISTLTLMLSGCGGIDLQNMDLAQVTNIATQLNSLKKPDQNEEIAIGRESTAVLLGGLGHTPIYPNDSVQHYVNLVGTYVASFSDRSQLRWKFLVSNDPDINAFAAPGGYVIVTLGLLAELENEAQLAAVLAHEIVHVEQEHHLKVLQANKYMSLATDTAMLAYTSQEEEPKLDPKIARKLLSATRSVYSLGLDKEDEFKADIRAISLLEQAGYDPYALIDVLQKIDATSAKDSKLALLLKTHPAPRARLEKLAENSPAQGWKDGARVEQRFFEQIALH